LVLLHGWPGSFYEFYPTISELQKLSQPFHIIVPSQIGYCFSSKPPVEKDFGTYDAAAVVQKLMKGLGLDGYIAAGGDIGSFIARALTNDEACRGCHCMTDPTSPRFLRLIAGIVNMYIQPDQEQGVSELTPADEISALERSKLFGSHGRGYMIMHGTRPSTIAHVLASSPVALLAWLGEKFLAWTDTDPSMEDILEKVALYWFTETFPSSIYPYREIVDRYEDEEWKKPLAIKKPMGFSWFPFELASVPIPWITEDKSASGNCIWWKKHAKVDPDPGIGMM
jgi:microsomal epoxide hydrolase